MGLFGRKAGPDQRQAEKFNDGLLGKLGLSFRRMEMRLAGYLNQKTSGYGFRQWLILLVSFCLVVGGYLGYLLLGIFN